MKKRLRFLYRYITTSRRFRRWFNTQTILILVVSCVFLTTISWTAPLSVDPQHREIPARRSLFERNAQMVSPLSISKAVEGISEETSQRSAGVHEEAALVAQTQPTETPSGPTPTPFPPEFTNNSQQTIGLTLSATILVLIVVFGVLAFMPKKNE